MNLKAYISLKFILTLVFLAVGFFLISNISSSYNSLKHRNEKLEEQKKLYESVLKLNPNDVEGKKNLYSLIELSDKHYKPMKLRKKIDFDTSIWIMFISFGLYFYILYLIDKRIDKLKAIENNNN